MNEEGITLIETVFGLAMLSLIALSLWPLLQQLQAHLYERQLSLYASEVALNGAKLVQFQQITAGQMTINQHSFDWYYAGQEICVYYEGLQGTEQRCIRAD